MESIAIRAELQKYIRFADDKKIKAIYTMVESDIKENYSWWKDEKFITALDKEYADYKNGKTKGFSPEEVQKNIDMLKKKRSKAR